MSNKKSDIWFAEPTATPINRPQPSEAIAAHPQQSAQDDELSQILKTVRSKERMILWCDPIGRPDEDNRREQCSRDDLWAISTEELNVITKVARRAKIQAEIDSYKLGLLTGAMPKAIGLPIAEQYLADLMTQLNELEKEQ